MTEAYDLRSNIKNKPGSQGTLFQVKDKGLLNPEQRWPRGYTPERQADVSRQMKVVKVKDPEQRARVVDTVARSTVPTQHIQGLREITPNVTTQGHAASYWPATRKVEIDMNKPDADKSLVHELGHHHDNMSVDRDSQIRRDVQGAATSLLKRKGTSTTKPTPTAVAVMSGRVTAGVREASADNYMVEHYRTKGRNPEPVTQGRYEENFTPERRDERFPGYNDVRPPASEHLGPQFVDGHLF